MDIPGISLLQHLIPFASGLFLKKKELTPSANANVKAKSIIRANWTRGMFPKIRIQIPRINRLTPQGVLHSRSLSTFKAIEIEKPKAPSQLRAVSEVRLNHNYERSSCCEVISETKLSQSSFSSTTSEMPVTGKIIPNKTVSRESIKPTADPISKEISTVDKNIPKSKHPIADSHAAFKKYPREFSLFSFQKLLHSPEKLQSSPPNTGSINTMVDELINSNKRSRRDSTFDGKFPLFLTFYSSYSSPKMRSIFSKSNLRQKPKLSSPGTVCSLLRLGKEKSSCHQIVSFLNEDGITIPQKEPEVSETMPGLSQKPTDPSIHSLVAHSDKRLLSIRSGNELNTGIQFYDDKCSQEMRNVHDIATMSKKELANKHDSSLQLPSCDIATMSKKELANKYDSSLHLPSRDIATMSKKELANKYDSSLHPPSCDIATMSKKELENKYDSSLHLPSRDIATMSKKELANKYDSSLHPPSCDIATMSKKELANKYDSSPHLPSCDIATMSKKELENKYDSSLHLPSCDIKNKDHHITAAKGDHQYLHGDGKTTDEGDVHDSSCDLSSPARRKVAAKEWAKQLKKDYIWEKQQTMKKKKKVALQEDVKRSALTSNLDKVNANRLQTTPLKRSSLLKTRFPNNTKKRSSSNFLQNDLTINKEKCRLLNLKARDICSESPKKYMSPISKEHGKHSRFNKMVSYDIDNFKHTGNKEHGKISRKCISKQAKPNISFAKGRSRMDARSISLSADRPESIRMVESLPSLSETDDTGISDTLAFADSSIYQSLVSTRDKPVTSGERSENSKTSLVNNELKGEFSKYTDSSNEKAFKEKRKVMAGNRISNEKDDLHDTKVMMSPKSRHKMTKSSRSPNLNDIVDSTHICEEPANNSDYPMVLDNLIRNSKDYIQNTRLLCRSAKSTMYEKLNVVNPQGPGSVRASKVRSTTTSFPTLMSFLDHIEKVDQERNDSLNLEKCTQNLDTKNKLNAIEVNEDHGKYDQEKHDEKTTSGTAAEQVASRQQMQSRSSFCENGLHFGTNELKLYSESHESMNSLKEDNKTNIKIQESMKGTPINKTVQAIFKLKQGVTPDLRRGKATDCRHWKKDALKSMKKNLDEIVGKRKIKIDHRAVPGVAKTLRSVGEKMKQQTQLNLKKKYKKSKENLNSFIGQETQHSVLMNNQTTRGFENIMKTKAKDTGLGKALQVGTGHALTAYKKQKSKTAPTANAQTGHNQKFTCESLDREAISSKPNILSRPDTQSDFTEMLSPSANILDIRKLFVNAEKRKRCGNNINKDFDLSLTKSGFFSDKNVTTSVQNKDVDHRDNVILKKVSQDKTQCDLSTSIQQSMLPNVSLKYSVAKPGSYLGSNSSPSHESLESSKSFGPIKRHELQLNEIFKDKLDWPNGNEVKPTAKNTPYLKCEDECQPIELDASDAVTIPQSKLDTPHVLSSSYTSKHKASDTKGKNLQSQWRGTVAFRKRLQHLLQHNKAIQDKQSYQNMQAYKQKMPFEVVSSNSQTRKEDNLYKVSKMTRHMCSTPHKTCNKNFSVIKMKKQENAQQLGGIIAPAIKKIKAQDKGTAMKANAKTVQSKKGDIQLTINKAEIGEQSALSIIEQLATPKKNATTQVVPSAKPSAESSKLIITHSDLFKQTIQSQGTKRIEGKDHKSQRGQHTGKVNQVSEATQVEVPAISFHASSTDFVSNVSVIASQNVPGSQYWSDARSNKPTKKRLEGVASLSKTKSPDINELNEQDKVRTVATNSPRVTQCDSKSMSHSERSTDEKDITAKQSKYSILEQSRSVVHIDICQDIPHRDFISGNKEDVHLADNASETVAIQTIAGSGLTQAENNLQQLLDKIKMNSFLAMTARKNKGIPLTETAAVFAEKNNVAVTRKNPEVASNLRQINISKPFAPLHFVNDLSDNTEQTKTYCVTDETAGVPHQSLVKGETLSAVAHTHVSHSLGNQLTSHHNKASQEDIHSKQKLEAFNSDVNLEIIRGKKSQTLIQCPEYNIGFEDTTSGKTTPSKTRILHRKTQHVATNSPVFQKESSLNVVDEEENVSSNIKHVGFQFKSQLNPMMSRPQIAACSVVASQDSRTSVPATVEAIRHTESFNQAQAHTQNIHLDTNSKLPSVVSQTQDTSDSRNSPDSEIVPSPDTSHTVEKHHSTSTEEISKQPDSSEHNTMETLSLTSLKLLLNSRTMKREISTPEFAQEPDPGCYIPQKSAVDYSNERMLLHSFMQNQFVLEINGHISQALSQTVSPFKRSLHMDAIPEEVDYESGHTTQADVNGADNKSSDTAVLTDIVAEPVTVHRNAAVKEKLLYEMEVVTIPKSENDKSALEMTSLEKGEKNLRNDTLHVGRISCPATGVESEHDDTPQDKASNDEKLRVTETSVVCVPNLHLKVKSDDVLNSRLLSQLKDTVPAKTAEHWVESKESPRVITQTVTDEKHQDRHKMQHGKNKQLAEYKNSVNSAHMKPDSEMHVADYQNATPNRASSRNDKALSPKIDDVELKHRQDEGPSSHLNTAIDSTGCDINLSLTKESASRGSVFSGIHTDSATHAKAVDLRGEPSPSLSSPDITSTDHQIITNDSITRVDTSEPQVLAAGKSRCNLANSSKKSHNAHTLNVPSADSSDVKSEDTTSKYILQVGKKSNHSRDQNERMLENVTERATNIGKPNKMQEEADPTSFEEASAVVSPNKPVTDREKSEDECTSDSISELIKKINITLKARSLSLCKVGSHNSHLFPDNILCLSKSDRKVKRIKPIETENITEQSGQNMSARKGVSDLLSSEKTQALSAIKHTLYGSDTCRPNKFVDLHADDGAERITESILTSTSINEATLTADETRSGSEIHQHPADEARSGSEIHQHPADEARSGSEIHQHPADEARSGNEKDQHPADEARSRNEKQHSPADEARHGNEKQHSPADEARSRNEKQQHSADEARSRNEKHQRSADEARSGIEKQQHSGDEVRLENKKQHSPADEARSRNEKQHSPADEARSRNEKQQHSADEARSRNEKHQRSADEARSGNEKQQHSADEARPENKKQHSPADEARSRNEKQQHSADEARSRNEKHQRSADEARSRNEQQHYPADEARPGNEKHHHPSGSRQICHSNSKGDAENIVGIDLQTVAQSLEHIYSTERNLQSKRKYNNKHLSKCVHDKHAKAEQGDKIVSNANDDLESLLNKELRLLGSGRQANQLFCVASDRAAQRRKRISRTQKSTSQVSGQCKLHSKFLRENDGSITCISSNTSQITCSPSEATVHHQSRHVKPLPSNRFSKLEEFLQKVEVTSRTETASSISKAMSKLSSFTSVTPSSQEEEHLLPLLNETKGRHQTINLKQPKVEQPREHKSQVPLKMVTTSSASSKSPYPNRQLLSQNSQNQLSRPPDKQQVENDQTINNVSTWKSQSVNQTNSHQSGNKFSLSRANSDQSRLFNSSDLGGNNKPIMALTSRSKTNEPQVCRKILDVETTQISRVTDSSQQAIKMTTNTVRSPHQRQEMALDMQASKIDSSGMNPNIHVLSDYQQSTRSSATAWMSQSTEESAALSTSSSSIILSWIGSDIADIEEIDTNMPTLTEHYTNVCSNVTTQPSSSRPPTPFSEKGLKLVRTYQPFEKRDRPLLSAGFTELPTAATTTDVHSPVSVQVTLNDSHNTTNTKYIVSRGSREPDGAKMSVWESEVIPRIISQENWQTCMPFPYREEPCVDNHRKGYPMTNNLQTTPTKDATCLSRAADFSLETAEKRQSELHSASASRNYPGESACTLDQPSYFNALFRIPKWNPSFYVKDEKKYPDSNELSNFVKNYPDSNEQSKFVKNDPDSNEQSKFVKNDPDSNDQSKFVINYVHSAWAYQNTTDVSPSSFSTQRNQYDNCSLAPSLSAKQLVATTGQHNVWSPSSIKSNKDFQLPSCIPHLGAPHPRHFSHTTSPAHARNDDTVPTVIKSSAFNLTKQENKQSEVKKAVLEIMARSQEKQNTFLRKVHFNNKSETSDKSLLKHQATVSTIPSHSSASNREAKDRSKEKLTLDEHLKASSKSGAIKYSKQHSKTTDSVRRNLSLEQHLCSTLDSDRNIKSKTNAAQSTSENGTTQSTSSHASLNWYKPQSLPSSTSVSNGNQKENSNLLRPQLCEPETPHSSRPINKEPTQRRVSQIFGAEASQKLDSPSPKNVSEKVSIQRSLKFVHVAQSGSLSPALIPDTEMGWSESISTHSSTSEYDTNKRQPPGMRRFRKSVTSRLTRQTLPPFPSGNSRFKGYKPDHELVGVSTSSKDNSKQSTTSEGTATLSQSRRMANNLEKSVNNFSTKRSRSLVSSFQKCDISNTRMTETSQCDAPAMKTSDASSESRSNQHSGHPRGDGESQSAAIITTRLGKKRSRRTTHDPVMPDPYIFQKRDHVASSPHRVAKRVSKLVEMFEKKCEG